MFLFSSIDMEDMIQILIFVGAMVIAVIGQNTKNKKKPMTAFPQEKLEDIFPEIDFEKEEESVPQVQSHNPIRKKTSVKKQQVSQYHVPVQQKEVTKQRKKISINGKREARQAFIYSEIFNRKY